MLSDGKTIAFSDTPRGVERGRQQLALISIGDRVRSLLDLETSGIVGYVDGTLIFTRPVGRLLAVKFDLGRRKVLGEPVELIADRTTGGPTRVTVSDNGTLAYLADAAPFARVELVDTLGTVTSSLPETRQYLDVVPSPDGKRIAITVGENNQADIWVYNVESRLLTRLTQTGAGSPSWTPDGKRIAFVGTSGVSWIPVDGGAPEAIPGTSRLGSDFLAVEISADGKYAVLRRDHRSGEPTRASRAVAVPLAGGEPIPLLEGADTPLASSVSPTGKWIAYESRETGRHEVFIRPFPSGAGKLQVSTDGGDVPRWSADGRKIFYRWDKEFHAVTLDVRGAMPRIVRADVLFANRDLTDRPIGSYRAHPDGKHFVVTRPMGDGTKLVVVPNWMMEVRAKLAGK